MAFSEQVKPSSINFSDSTSFNNKITSFSSLKLVFFFNHTFAQCPERILVLAPVTLLIQATLPWRRRRDFSEYVDGHSHLIVKETRRKKQDTDTEQLKKDRDENIKAVAADFDAALAELRAKVVAWQEDLQRQR
jgi:hypothetical protein